MTSLFRPTQRKEWKERRRKRGKGREGERKKEEKELVTQNVCSKFGAGKEKKKGWS